MTETTYTVICRDREIEYRILRPGPDWATDKKIFEHDHDFRAWAREKYSVAIEPGVYVRRQTKRPDFTGGYNYIRDIGFEVL